MAQLVKLFEPGKIGTLEIKNRLVMAAMNTRRQKNDDNIDDRIIDYYIERAKGGVGLIIGQAAITMRETARPLASMLYDDTFIPSFKRLADAVHRYGTKIGWQLMHPGKIISAAQAVVPSLECIGPSAIPWVANGIAPKEATKADIDRIVRSFGEAGLRLKKAGYDLVEIHGCHTDLISSFLSPLDNRRTDEYGGSAENRARFACEVTAAIRAKVEPDFPIVFRLSGSDYLEGGITIEDMTRIAPMLVEAGADSVSASAGQYESYQWAIPDFSFPDALNIHLAEAIKKAVSVPVIAAGKIPTPQLAEQILQDGKADFIALARPLLVDPEFPNKAKEGRFNEIRRCIYCMGCMVRTPRDNTNEGFSCTINPSLLREREFCLEPAASSKRVMVIGGGLAGMEAARVLAERGHKVTLYERDNKLGGQWNIAAQQPHKEAFASIVEDMSRGLNKAGVKIVLNKGVTPEFVRKEKPDAVVLATGARPALPDLAGVNGKNVVQAVDVITGKAKVGNRVVVVGGRYIGLEVAADLAEQGKKVYLVTRRRLGRDIERRMYCAVRDRLISSGAYLYPNAPLREIRENGVYIDFEKELVFLKADTVVLAMGSKPESKLIEELKGVISELYAIGDCVNPRDAMEAIREGAEVGRKI